MVLGKQIERGYKAGISVFPLRGRSAMWLRRVYSAAQGQTDDISSIRNFIMRISNPFVPASVDTKSILAYFMLKNLCGFRDTTFFILFCNYSIVEDESANMTLRLKEQ